MGEVSRFQLLKTRYFARHLFLGLRLFVVETLYFMSLNFSSTSLIKVGIGFGLVLGDGFGLGLGFWCRCLFPSRPNHFLIIFFLITDYLPVPAPLASRELLLTAAAPRLIACNGEAIKGGGDPAGCTCHVLEA